MRDVFSGQNSQSGGESGRECAEEHILGLHQGLGAILAADLDCRGCNSRALCGNRAKLLAQGILMHRTLQNEKELSLLA